MSTTEVVDRPTQLICISDIYLSIDTYKRHSSALGRSCAPISEYSCVNCCVETFKPLYICKES